MSNLIEELKQIPDFRKNRGKCYPLWVLLLLTIMGILAGYQGYRPLQHFVQEHHESLCQLLGIELKRVPSFSTFRRMMMGLDVQQFSDRFESWMLSQSQDTSVGSGDAAMDGKRICQGLTDDQGVERFVGLVSLFGLEHGVTLKLQALTEEENSEITVVQSLLEALELEGLMITMDALHAQKNTALCA